MPFANREGVFRAQVVDQSVTETGDNKLVTVILRFLLLAEPADQAADEWADISQEGLEITSYIYLERRDGSVNEMALKQLRQAFGWDGVDLDWLETTELPDCQVRLEYETYKGADKLRVQWLDAFDASGSTIPQASDEERKRIRSRFASKLRAVSGGSPAAKPAAKPKANAPAKKPPAPPARPPARRTAPAAPAAPPKPPEPEPEPETKPTSDMDSAWAAFTGRAPEGLDPTKLEASWFATLEQFAGTTDPEKVTPEQWARIEAEGDPSVPF